MSTNQSNSNQSEEVDLGQLFKTIGNLFDRLYRFIESKFRFIFSIFIFSIKAIVNNFKLIFISMALAGLLGYGLEKIKDDVYTSKMLVKPYFDSKYQLIDNINYYNALIKDKDYDVLSNVFEISKEKSEQLIEFEIEVGPESENDKRLQYQKFVSSLDSVRSLEVNFKDFKKNKSIYDGSVYEIKVKSFSQDIFKSLEKGLNFSFSNGYSIKKKKKRDSLIAVDKLRIEKSLIEVDSLQNIYEEVLRNESNTNQNLFTLKDGMSLVQERTKTKEYELLEKQLQLRKDLADLESKKVEEDVYFDILSDFRNIGLKHSSFWNKYSLIFPLLVFVLLSFIYLTNKTIVFVKTYEG